MSDAAFKIDDGATLRGPSLVPEPRTRPADEEATGATVLDWSEVFDRYARKPKKYPLWNAHVEDRAFAVMVHKEDGHWFAENEAYDVVGHGVTVHEALSDAYDNLKYLAQELLPEPDEMLSDHALDLKRKYEHIRFA